jgi:ATP-dependent Clp protease ATP-binding subunit ClpA
MASLSSLVRRAGRASRPDEGLPAIATLRKELDALERHHVATAIVQDWSWSEVAKALGVSKQAAHKKHAEAVRTLTGDDATYLGGETVVVTAQARAAVGFAREEARVAGSEVVGAEHLLLGALRAEKGPIATALEATGVTLPTARRSLQPTPPEVEADIAAGAADTASAAARTGVAPLARACLERSLREAVRRGDRHLGVEHLLLSLLGEPDGGAARTLEALGVSATQLRRELEPLIEAQ